MDERDRKLLGLDDEYTRELSILRELLAAGSKRDRDKMLQLAQGVKNESAAH